VRILCWLLGHKRKYVGVEDRFDKSEIYPKYCPHEHQFIRHCHFCWNVMQIARWVCERCPKMGELPIRKGEGVYTVHFGKLVPDEKKWANHKLENFQ
jgi:hypothetical protein